MRDAVQRSSRLEFPVFDDRLGRRCPGVRIEYATGETSSEPTWATMFFDSEHGGMIRLVRGRHAPKRLENGEALPGFRYEREITNVEQVSGVWFPREAVFRACDADGNVRQTMTGTVTRVCVNEPVADEALDFRFPENALVHYDPPVDRNRRVVLWGADNRPRAEPPTDVRLTFETLKSLVP